MEKLCNLWEYKVQLQQMHMFIYILWHFVLGFSVYSAWNDCLFQVSLLRKQFFSSNLCCQSY